MRFLESDVTPQSNERNMRKWTLQNSEWYSGENHRATINDIKRIVTSVPVLKYYDQKKELIL